MAARRMLSIGIIDSDLFLSLSKEAQNLYFHFAMRADDDGFINNPIRLRKMLDANESEMQELIDNGFILTFESGVIVITHWKVHNYIQADRYKETMCKAEKNLLIIDENKIYHFKKNDCIHSVSKMDTQVRLELGKGSLGKDSSSVENKNTTSIQKTTTETITTTTNNNNNNNNIPSRIDIENYLKEVGFSIDIDDFIAYNDTRGWKINNWKSAVRRWKNKEAFFADKNKQTEKNSKYNFEKLQKSAFDNITARAN